MRSIWVIYPTRCIAWPWGVYVLSSYISPPFVQDKSPRVRRGRHFHEQRLLPPSRSHTGLSCDREPHRKCACNHTFLNDHIGRGAESRFPSHICCWWKRVGWLLECRRRLVHGGLDLIETPGIEVLFWKFEVQIWKFEVIFYKFEVNLTKNWNFEVRIQKILPYLGSLSNLDTLNRRSWGDWWFQCRYFASKREIEVRIVI